MLEEIRAGFDTTGELYDAVKLKAALTEARRLSQRVNQYLNEKAPWQSIKEDPTAAATSVYVALQAIDWLKLIWAPILPHTSDRLHSMFGYDGSLFGRMYTERVTDAGAITCCFITTMMALSASGHVTELPAGQELAPAVCPCSPNWTKTEWRRNWRPCTRLLRRSFRRHGYVN